MSALDTGLFGRRVSIEFGLEGASGRRISDLRVGFKVQHKLGPTPSTATVRIYNLAQASVSLLQAPRAVLRLFVGYEPLEKLVFAGNPIKNGIDLKVEGADRILEVDASDGGRAYAETMISVSYSTPTTFGQVLELVLAQTQWARGTILVPEALSFPHGIVLHGRPSDVMRRLAAAVPPLGADWYVRDGALYVLPKGQSTPEVAPLISSAQGNLIGSPASTKGGIKVRALIDATMRPGRAFVLESLGHSGTYVARDVTFTGDSGFERDFYMDLVAKPLGVP